MLVGALLLMAALAIVERRIAIASLCISVGITIHEVAAIYGLPLFIAIMIDQKRYKTLNVRSALAGCSMIFASIAIYIVTPMLSHQNAKAIVETIRFRIPHEYLDEYADRAMYTIVGGVKTFKIVLCINFRNSHFLFNP